MSKQSKAVDKDKIQTINLDIYQTGLAVPCCICEKGIPVYDINHTPMFCEECLKRLKEVLYGERGMQ